MKLLSYRDPVDSTVRLGALVDSGHVVDLHGASAGALPADMRQFLYQGPSALKRAREIAASPPAVLDLANLHLLPVVPDPGKVLCVALNFQSHIDECRAHGMNFLTRPERPLLSPKVPSTLIGHGADIPYPSIGKQLDYEIELAFVIGRVCRNARRDEWRDYVAGFTVANDLTLRDIISFPPVGLIEGKNFDAALPLGPWLVTNDEIAEPSSLHLRLRVNGKERQSESMANAFFDAGAVIEYWSSRMTLLPGDVFTLGCPAGVGFFSKDPASALLRPGDVVEAEISGIGTLVNQIVASTGKPT